MTNYTRRSFVKRTGSATLGAALGLGLLPSLTRKLHAADTSAAKGVLALNPSGERRATFPTIVSIPHPNGPVVVGNLTLSCEYIGSPPFGSCVPSLTITRKLSLSFEIVAGGLSYLEKEKNWTMTGRFRCVNNGVVF